MSAPGPHAAAWLFVDTSALVKLYVRESGTESMVAAARSSSWAVGILSVARVELASALQRRCATGDLDAGRARAIRARMERHAARRYHVVHVTDQVIERAVGLVERHQLRAYDAMQLAGALALPASPAAVRFACADLALLRAATSEKLDAWNPASSTDD